jgi:choline transporter-like protein 2/4/5
MLVYHLFGLLWTSQFIWGITVVIVAGAVSEFYFTPDKSDLQKRPVAAAVWRAIRFHLGSIAFGALLIALVQMARLALEYIDRKTKALQKRNRLVRFAIACLRCCLWFFEKVVKFITKYAFVFVAMRGDSFMKAARGSVGLILGYTATIMVVESVSEILFLLSKFMIVVGSGLAAYVWLDRAPEFQEDGATPLESSILPVLLAAILGYAVADIMLGVYNITVDTLLACYCMDREENNGADKPYYMSDNLASVMDKSAQTRKAALEAQASIGPAGDGSSKVVPAESAGAAAGSAHAGAELTGTSPDVM